MGLSNLLMPLFFLDFDPLHKFGNIDIFFLQWEYGLWNWSHLVSRSDFQQCILSIERMHSGARRYVTVDFGKLVLLTDIYVPACPHLMSITIETWCQREETDPVRVALSSDIGSKSLLLTDIQPAILCRFLKV
jgi:baculoviral IAP repeat-containing protein 6